MSKELTAEVGSTVDDAERQGKVAGLEMADTGSQIREVAVTVDRPQGKMGDVEAGIEEA